jgi:hypothetical protein
MQAKAKSMQDDHHHLAQIGSVGGFGLKTALIYSICLLFIF